MSEKSAITFAQGCTRSKKSIPVKQHQIDDYQLLEIDCKGTAISGGEM